MGRGAKIFIISFLISAALFGLISFAVLSALSNLTAPMSDPSLLSDGAVVKAPSGTGGKSFNLLVINVDYRPEKYSYDKSTVTALFGDTGSVGSSLKRSQIRMLSAVLVRIDREREEFTFTPISAETVVQTKKGATTLSAAYLSGGISALRAQVKLLTGITVDNYALITPSGAERITDSLGGFNYSVVSSITATDEAEVPSGNQTLTGKKVRTMMLFENAGGAVTRESVSAELLKLFFDKLTKKSENDAKEILKNTVGIIKTDVSEKMISDVIKLICSYQSFEKKELAVVGRYSGGRFEPDVEATLDRFSNYRKYYG